MLGPLPGGLHDHIMDLAVAGLVPELLPRIGHRSRLPCPVDHPIGYKVSLVTRSHAFSTSAVSVTSAAARVSASCSGCVAPMIVAPMKSWVSVHAAANVATDMPAACAISTKRPVDLRVRAFTKRWNIALVRGLPSL